MNSSNDEQRARARTKQLSGGMHWLGAWALYYGVPAAIAFYAFLRGELVGIMIMIAVILSVSAWQFISGYRHNRALDRLLQRYENNVPEPMTPDDRRAAS